MRFSENECNLCGSNLHLSRARNEKSGRRQTLKAVRLQKDKGLCSWFIPSSNEGGRSSVKCSFSSRAPITVRPKWATYLLSSKSRPHICYSPASWLSGTNIYHINVLDIINLPECGFHQDIGASLLWSMEAAWLVALTNGSLTLPREPPRININCWSGKKNDNCWSGKKKRSDNILGMFRFMSSFRVHCSGCVTL